MKIMILLPILIIFSFVAHGKICLCGDYPTHYTYYVVGDGGCCSGVASANLGQIKTYAADAVGNWILIDNSYQESSLIQSHCCEDVK